MQGIRDAELTAFQLAQSAALTPKSQHRSRRGLVTKGEVAVAYQVQDAEGTGKELVKIGEKKGERGDERHHKSCWREG